MRVSFINTGKLSGVAYYALDLWVEQWRRRNGHGDIIIVRYADDFVLGFEHHLDAQRFLKELRERLARFKRPWRGNSSVFYALQALVPNRELLDLPAGR